MADEEVARSRGSNQQNSKHNGPEREYADRTEEGDIRNCKYSEKSIRQNATLKEGTRQKEQTDRETQAREAEIDACRRDNNNSNTERRLETPR